MTTSSLSLPAGRDRTRALPISFPRPELAVLLVAAGVLYVWALDRNGFANEYYSAAVRSMTTSWHAFLYGAFEPGASVATDKPPLDLWLQVASTKLLGFTPFALHLPQAVA